MAALALLIVIIVMVASAGAIAVLRPDLLPERFQPLVAGRVGVADENAPCPLTPWVPSGSCRSGYQMYVRNIDTSAGPPTRDCNGKEMSKVEPCSAVVDTDVVVVGEDEPEPEPAPPASVDCATSAWSEPSACSAQCGGGVRSRTRTVTRRPVGAGRACPPLVAEESCNEHACSAADPPIDCQVGNWGAWSACSKECGGGTSARSRSVARPASGGGRACGPLTESKPCNEHACGAERVPVDCAWSSWGPWSTCTKDCGDEIKTRSRTVARPAADGGRACAGANSETASCGHDACPAPAPEPPSGAGLPSAGLQMLFLADSLPLGSAAGWKSSSGSAPGEMRDVKNTNVVEIDGKKYADMRTNDDYVAWKPNRLQTHVWSVDVSVIREMAREPLLLLYDQSPQKSNGGCEGECYRFYVGHQGESLMWNGSFGFSNSRIDVPESGKLVVAVVFAQSTVSLYANGKKIASRDRIARFAEPGSEKYKYGGSNHVLSFAHKDRSPGILARALAVYHRALSEPEVFAAFAALV